MQSPSQKHPPVKETIGILRENSLSMLAHHELKRRIITGELAAGAKLNEAEIALALGVSRGPVREAFLALDQAGLVRVEKNRGVFVREVSLEEADEIYEVRAALESMIGRLAARHIGAADLAALRAIVKKMAALDTSRKAAPYFKLNVDFHDLLARAARNQSLLVNYRRVINELDLYRRETIARSTANIPLSTQEHAAIVDAIAAHDEKRAATLMFDHVMRSRERLHDVLKIAPTTSAKPPPHAG